MKRYILSRTILLSILLLASSVQTSSVLAASMQTPSVRASSTRASILQTQIVPYIQTENTETQYQSSQEQLAVVEQELAVTQEDLVTAQDQLATSQDQLATTQDELAQAESEIQSLIDSCSSSDPACASELESTQDLLLVTRESYLDALIDITSLSGELIETQASYLDALVDISNLNDELVVTQESYLDALVDISNLNNELIVTQESYLDALETIGSLTDEFSTIGSLMDELDLCDAGVAVTQDAIVSLDLTIGSLIDDLFLCGSLVDATEESIQETLAALETVLPVSKIAAGSLHTVILLENGSVWASGFNGNGQLGTGNTFDRTAFTRMVTDPSDIFIDIAAGSNHSLALKNDGTVWATGNNGSGQLGIGSNDSQTTLIAMTESNNNNITALAAGENHSLVLKNDGTVWGTGLNDDGQLGTATNDAHLTLIPMGDPFGVTFNDISALAAGGNHSLVLKNDGTVYGTGANGSGQLGIGPQGSQFVLTPMTDFNSSITALATSGNHSLVLKTDGTVWTTGDNANGQLGIGTSGDFRLTLTEMTNFNSSVTALAAGGNHSLVLKSDGTVYASGLNSNGQLGDGTNVSKNVLTAMTTDNSNIAAISAGGSHAAVLKSDGTVWVTGSNAAGQLARGLDPAALSQANTLAPTKRLYYRN